MGEWENVPNLDDYLASLIGDAGDSGDNNVDAGDN